MNSDSDNESIEGEINVPSKKPAADWGKTKFNYYFTDYVDKDYPSDLTKKEERAAALEQDEALRLQKKLLSTIDNVCLQPIIDLDELEESKSEDEDLLGFLENQNRTLLESKSTKKNSEENSKKRKKISFEDIGSDECEFDDDEEDEDEIDTNQDQSSNCKQGISDHDGRNRRPINMAIRKNRGLTPYKKKEYRNPRVKHKIKYNKAMIKRRRMVKEAKSEFHRYSGETTGIKTSTVRSIRLC